MTHEAWIGIWCFLGTMALLLTGMPIFLAILLGAFVGSWLVGGMTFIMHQLATSPYWVTANYAMAVIPMFVLMGVLAANTGLGEIAYNAASKWFGRFRGGLLMATLGAGAIFGACNGSGLASVALFSKLALPELDKHGYDNRWSLGVIAATSVLAVLIPPSVDIIVICILANLSIGKMLVAGIIPGIVCTVMLIITVAILGKISPKRMPKVQTLITWKERFTSLSRIWPVLLLFLLVIGGTYAGVFPPTVGGAIGSFGVLIYALFVRTPGKRIWESCKETVLIGGQIFPILIAGYIFSRFISICGLPNIMVKLITEASMPPMLVLLIIVAFYLFCGCVLEFFSVMVITVPVVFPIITGLGFDPIMAGIVIVFLGNIAGLTPPIGMTVFLLAAISKVPTARAFAGVFPFFLTEFVLMMLIIFIPGIASWLPNLFYK